MSQKREIIILEPDGLIHKEAFCTRPVICPKCGGKGWFDNDIGLPEMTCPGCEGSGEVIALVTVDWKPNKAK